MTDNELLPAIADIMNKKIRSALGAELQPVKEDIQDLKHRMANIELHLENITNRNIQLLAENYLQQLNDMKRPQHRLKQCRQILM